MAVFTTPLFASSFQRKRYPFLFVSLFVFQADFESALHLLYSCLKKMRVDGLLWLRDITSKLTFEVETLF